MKKREQFIQLLSIAVLLFAFATACDKSDDPGGDAPSAGTVKDADGNKYNTVKIGNQVWMVENLKTTKYNNGTSIPNVADVNHWVILETGAYCNYKNNESNSEIYGRLYNWYAVETGKLAPKGWHVPTDDDWTILENYLIANGYNYDGTKEGNKFAKSLASKTGWDYSEYEGTPGNLPQNNNSTGFKALPAGRRSVYDGFNNIGEADVWWSSTESNEGIPYNRFMNYQSDELYRSISGKGNGLSIRLVKD